ncbi:MAG: HTTM domain-containing protein [Bacteroidota bacterium]
MVNYRTLFALYLDNYYRSTGMKDPHIRAEVWVTLNARPAKLLVDPKVDLTTIEDSWLTKDWIVPFDKSAVR